ncbi:MAG TPA: PIG-L family deacetylase [Jatrophihabitans sp.]|nr:PIG-L family deacetylase [Jatrophihabitans sp.]
MSSRVIAGTGTASSAWRAAPGWARLPEVGVDDLVPPGHRLVVMAPHPDDEVLAAGGLMRTAALAGRQVLVLALTDGGASHPGSTRWPARLLSAQRRAESATAMRALGLPAGVLHRLGLPDGRLAACEAELRMRLPELIGPADVLVAPWRWDGHPDHEAAGRVCAAVAEAVGIRWLEAPIWGWHWCHPDDPAFPWSRAVALALTPATQAGKQRAVQLFVSQLQPDPSTGADPILPGWALDRLVHEREVFLR